MKVADKLNTTATVADNTTIKVPHLEGVLSKQCMKILFMDTRPVRTLFG